MLDSLKIYEILKGNSLPEPHARAVTLAIQKAESEIALDVKTVVEEHFQRTSQQVQLFQQQFQQQFVTFKEYCDTTFATKVDLARMEARLTHWMVGFWIGQTAVIIAAIKLFK